VIPFRSNPLSHLCATVGDNAPESAKVPQRFQLH
jgi:hypothetical protein